LRLKASKRDRRRKTEDGRRKPRDQWKTIDDKNQSNHGLGLSSLDERFGQTCEHPPNLFKTRHQLGCGLAVKKPQSNRYLQMRRQLVRRSEGDIYEASEFARSATPAPFGEVGAYRHRRTPGLLHQAEPFSRRIAIGRPIDRNNQRLRFLPNVKISEISHWGVVSPRQPRCNIVESGLKLELPPSAFRLPPESRLRDLVPSENGP
jgi:hypothetical protein